LNTGGEPRRDSGLSVCGFEDVLYRVAMPDSSDTLDSQRLWVVIATIAINVLAVAVLVFVRGSNWRTAVALNLIDNALLVGFALWKRDGLMARFILFGLAAGFVELAADAWLVDFTHTLDYSPGGGLMLWRSPAWMPFAWEIVAVQFGYLALRLWERFRAAGLVMIGVLGAINIPYYEEMARRIHWWQYSDCRMISNTPLYIIVGEFLIAVGFGLLVRRFRSGNAVHALLMGVAGGGVIFVSYAIGYGLTDRLVR
jgi:hypothetical protein